MPKKTTKKKFLKALKLEDKIGSMSPDYKSANKVAEEYFLALGQGDKEKATMTANRFTRIFDPILLKSQPEEELLHTMKQLQKFVVAKHLMEPDDYKLYIKPAYKNLKAHIVELNKLKSEQLVLNFDTAQ